jgi:uncharacterized protein (DUF1800 family)
MLGQNELIRRNALGDFKALLHGMSTDTAMLVWLDGNANRKRHPNENFAREIMELFALGVGNYTEKDIQEAARAFTGWHVRDGRFWKNSLQHDESVKTVLGKSGPFDGNEVVEICLAQKACPQFLATKLAKTFVSADPSAESIAGLASRIRHHDFQMKPVMHKLLSSQWFFEAGSRRAIIKSPLDLVLGALRTLTESVRWTPVISLLSDLGQSVFEPPSVKGWEGGRLWITSQSLLQRANFATEVTSTDKYGPLVPVLRQIASESPEVILQKLEQWLLSDALDETGRRQISEFYARASGSSDQRLRGLLQLIITLPEFQLM